ncbi:beta-ketoacyl-ACP synthase II [Streptomyces lavendulae]|uniref:beta-ketoacyl-ACP synthase II n=1 Tax=Streptomyces lavendulae TaxID=1914 RepID=UPI00380BB6B2
MSATPAAPEVRPPVTDPDRRVVVTGIGIVCALGESAAEVWSGLLAGHSAAAPIQGFDARDLPVRIAAEATAFDARTWLSVRDAARLDRYCHFAVAASDLALADAGRPTLDRENTATSIGSAIGGIGVAANTILRTDGRPTAVSPYFIPAMIPNMAAGAVAVRHGLRGPSLAASTACAASADAIGQGYRLIRDGRARACLAGGAEAPVTEPIVAGFHALRALSRRNDAPGQACRPFDAERDGFVIGEGAAILLLEAADAAVARGARIYAEICGYGQSSDAHHATTPAPSGVQAARAMRAALLEAGLESGDVDYINAHATATQLGDAAETRAIKHAFGRHSRRLAVSSTKSMTGHLLGAAGALEAAICALAIDAQEIPPTRNYHTPDPACDLDYVPHHSRTTLVRAALSNSFAFGGHNVALAFREYPTTSH